MGADGASAPARAGPADVERFRACEQCGVCSSACPLTGRDGFNIRRIIRHVELDLVDEIAETGQAWQCTLCARCETACPNGIALLDLLRHLRARAPDGVVPAGPPACVRACPAGIDIPGYLRHLAQGRPRQAYELILESAPFPGVLGRVCTHPCEAACRRSLVNEPLAICRLKRFAADEIETLSDEALRAGADTGRRVAVVGAGPAGLTAAFYLRKKGHAVTVLEARQKPGGMLRYGIPRYRLPEDVLDREIDQILGMGIELRTGVALGRDVDVHALRAEGHEAVFLAAGLQQARRIELEGADLPGVAWGLDLLGAVARGETVAVGRRVVVIGGGDVAVDVALTLLRLGARAVTMACLEQRAEMPAHPWEIEQALEEGVVLETGWGPVRIVGEGDATKGIDLVACTSVFDEEGRFAPTFGAGRRHAEADQIVLAVGQTADLAFLEGAANVEARADLLVVDPATGETGMPGVFAGGEIATGPGAMIDAIADGKRVAASIDRYLGGDGVVQTAWAERAPTTAYDGKRPRGFADRRRMDVPTLPVAERHAGFPEIDLPLDGEAVAAEADRCLHCDLERHPERLL